jgi:hypothetical protein
VRITGFQTYNNRKVNANVGIDELLSILSCFEYEIEGTLGLLAWNLGELNILLHEVCSELLLKWGSSLVAPNLTDCIHAALSSNLEALEIAELATPVLDVHSACHFFTWLVELTCFIVNYFHFYLFNFE